MNELMQKITEKLSVSIDKIPEVYEGLKWQYVIYDVCNNLIFISSIVVIIIFIFAFLVAGDKIQYSKPTNKELIILFIPCFVIVIFIMFLYVFRNIQAPDIIFLKGVLN